MKSFCQLIKQLLAQTIVWLLFTTGTAHAEYRVYQLQINDEKGDVKRMIVTTLDHLQYTTYYPLYFGETIEYIDSWMCWERGDYFQKYCPNPKTQTDDKARFPASEGPQAQNN